MVHFTNWEEKEGEPTMGPIRGRASSEPKILVTSREAACPLAVGPWTPLAGRTESHRPDPVTLAMVLASSLYAESSVEGLDWPTCWVRKQQKRALKMLRPRGFLREVLETRPRAEGTTKR